jgi:hypothetical protein
MYKTFFSIGKEFEWKRQKRLAGTSGEHLVLKMKEKAKNSLC